MKNKNRLSVLEWIGILLGGAGLLASTVSFSVDAFTQQRLLEQASRSCQTGDWTAAAAALQDASLVNNAVAMHNLGYLYAHGYGVEQDVEAGIEYYNRAIQLDHADTYTDLIALEYNQGRYGDRQEFLVRVEAGYRAGNQTCGLFLANLVNPGAAEETLRANVTEWADQFAGYDSEKKLELLLQAEEQRVLDMQPYTEADLQISRQSFVMQIQPVERRYEKVQPHPQRNITSLAGPEQPAADAADPAAPETGDGYAYVPYGDITCTVYPYLDLFQEHYLLEE